MREPHGRVCSTWREEVVLRLLSEEVRKAELAVGVAVAGS